MNKSEEILSELGPGKFKDYTQTGVITINILKHKDTNKFYIGVTEGGKNTKLELVTRGVLKPEAIMKDVMKQLKDLL